MFGIIDMLTQRGLPVNTTSVAAVDSINHFHQQIMSVGPYAKDILTAAKIHPQEILIQTYAAAYYLLAQEDNTTHLATHHLLKAAKSLQTANLREQLTYQAVCAWQRLDYEGAITLFTAITALYPRDTLAAKFAEWLFYCNGQFVHAHRYLALCERMAAANQDESHFIAMHSFAWQLTGNYANAKALAEKAIMLERVTPWAHHSLAHMYLLNHDWENGICCLQSLRDSWELIMPLLKGHNTWHLALFYLVNRNKSAILDLINSGVFDTMPDTVAQQLDIISLLWRMDLAGLSQDGLFHGIAKHLKQHPFEHYMGFNNVHFIYCLVKANEYVRLQKALSAMERYALSLPRGSTQQLWQHIILPFCKGVVAFVHQDYHHASHLFKPMIERCFLMGGSDAQNDLFFQTYLICLIHCHQYKQARHFFNQHLAYYTNTPLEAALFKPDN